MRLSPLAPCLSPPVILLLTVPRLCFLCGPFLLFMFHVCLCYAVLSAPCSLAFTCWERADNLGLLCVMFSCVFVTLPHSVQGKVWYLIVSTSDICLLSYFREHVFIKLSADRGCALWHRSTACRVGLFDSKWPSIEFKD